MATEVTIVLNGKEVKVSSNGELITRAFDYSTPAFQNMDTVDVAFNFFKPRAGFQFTVTGAVISGNRDIGVNGSIVILYEATSETSTTVGGRSIELEVPKSTVLPFIFPNVIFEEGTFGNGKCDDNNVRVALFGYFVPKIS